jgi:hypothetical membrane protein
MSTLVLARTAAQLSVPAARMAIAAAAAEVVLLASLHVLSPEFDPSWRVISEYANGQYAWVLSLMFIAGALSSWALAFAIRSELGTTAGRIGLGFLLASGVGSAMASVFDINHPLHDLAGLLGVLGFPIAAMLISLSLTHTQRWSAAKHVLLLTANLTWVSLVLMIAALIAMIVTYTQAGGDMSSPPAVLPAGVIALVGYANRLVIVAGCVWTAIVARQSRSLGFHSSP